MAGKASKGTVLKRGSTSVGDITTISGPNMTAASIDVTTHDSPGWNEYLPGMKNGGEISFDVNFTNSASQQAVRDDLGQPATAYTIEFPAGLANASFSAFVSAFGPSAGGVNDKLSASITLTISGAVTWSVPTP